MRPGERLATTSRATLIVFTREPIAGTTKTRLIPYLGADGSAALAHAFTLDALAKARAVGAGLVIAGSAPESVEHRGYFRRLAKRFGADLIDQGGGSLGARMSRALAPYHAAGALLIGTDTPSLPEAMLARNLALLRRFPVVLGPSLDGGYYAIGVRGALPDIFRGIRWGRSHVLADTIARLEASGMRYALANAWYDVDRWSDVLVLAAHLRMMRPEAHPCPATAHILRRLGLLETRG